MLSKEKRDFIQSLADENGHIEPSTVIAAARPPGSVIHDDFEWDLERAALNDWTETARRLIRFVKLQVIIERETVVAPLYVSDPVRPSKSKRFVDLTVAAQQTDIAQQILMDELDRIVAQIRRAQEIAKVLGAWAQEYLVVALENVTELKTRAERKKDEKEKKRARRGKPAGRSRRSGTRPEMRA